MEVERVAAGVSPIYAQHGEYTPMRRNVVRHSERALYIM